MTSTVPVFTGTLSTPIATAPPAFSIGENNRLQASQLRIVTIVMTAFNIACAASMVFRILWDARRVYMKRRRKSKNGMGNGDMGEEAGEFGNGNSGGKIGGMVAVKGVWDDVEKGRGNTKKDGERGGMGGGGGLVPAIEVFPLVLGGAILIQGILLAFVESIGLDGRPITKNCGYLSEVAWVAQWITPFMVFSFTLEACVRAISQPRFKRRSGAAVAGCIALALFLLFLTWVPTRTMPARPENNICSGQLMSYTDQFAAGGLGIMAALLPLSVSMGAVVFIHLHKDCGVDRVEKISTSRTVYFLIINVPQWIMMLPNYAVTAKSGPKHGLVYLATFIINLSGVAAAVLHLYLRAETPSWAQSPHSSTSSSRARSNTSSRRPPPPHEKPPPPYQKPKSALRSHTHHQQQQQQPSPPLPPSQQNRANRLSSYTARSSQRLGDEITTLLSNISPLSPSSPSSQNPQTQTSTSTPPITPNSPSYTLFPPIPTRYRHLPDQPPSSTISTISTSTSTPHTSTSTNTSPPQRPSRTATPIVNMSRSQSTSAGPKMPEKALLAQQRPKRRFLVPAAAIEVAVPPGSRRGGNAGDFGDAESFREILVWKGEGRVSAQETVVGRLVPGSIIT
ncbi:hypothetical protein L873DRAFT_1789108 [Choiromyces venosus 120613-1]|uniref:Uncharacterized protein n=1 Tax=Choiromyces venosus 120613-1 TaxID=1336337 RepID=A0A3N4K2M7_9PEZI|nr:hypothetical protein L873DRAFT_1789108 [Choiromyces venosus 120613-1]